MRLAERRVTNINVSGGTTTQPGFWYYTNSNQPSVQVTTRQPRVGYVWDISGVNLICSDINDNGAPVDFYVAIIIAGRVVIAGQKITNPGTPINVGNLFPSDFTLYPGEDVAVNISLAALLGGHTWTGTVDLSLNGEIQTIERPVPVGRRVIA